MPEYVSRGGSWVLKETTTESKEPAVVIKMEEPKIEPKEEKVEKIEVQPETKSKRRGRPPRR